MYFDIISIAPPFAEPCDEVAAPGFLSPGAWANVMSLERQPTIMLSRIADVSNHVSLRFGISEE
jgi:hypothetical protein